jgi:hypothetical protein
MSTVEETQEQAMNVARMLLLMVDADDLDALLREYSRMDSVMPLFDPTGYKRVMGNIPKYRTVVQALATARKQIAAVLQQEGVEL